MKNTWKKLLAGLLACSLAAGAVPADIGALDLFTAAPIAVSAENHTNGTVLLSELKVGDYISNTVTSIVVSDEYDTYINFTVTLKADGYCTPDPNGSSMIFFKGNTDKVISNTYFLTLYQGQISNYDGNNGELFYPYSGDGWATGWFVVAVDQNAKTLTLSGKAPSEKTNISDATVVADQGAGNVTVSVGDKTLTSDDFDVEYIKEGESSGSDKFPTEAGSYTVKVTGKGDYYGEVTKKFTVEPLFTGASLTLCDDIALNFFASGITAANASEYKVMFDGNCIDSESGFVNKGGEFCATAHVYAKNMDEKIKATIFDKNGYKVGKSVTYSVKDYLTSSEHDNADAKTKALLKATELFGNASAEYFYDGDKGYSDALAEYLSLTDQRESDLKTYAAKSDFDFIASNAMISLVLDTRTAIRIYIKGVAPGTRAGSYVSQENTKSTSTEYPSFFEIGGLTPGLLAKEYTISLNGTDYKFSALSWANRVFKNGLSDDNRNVKMAKAVTAYYLAARSYLTAPVPGTK